MASSIDGKSICFTGTLQQQTRTEATKTATTAGARVVKTISAKVDIVVCGEGAGAKLTQAKAKGCTVWTEEEFMAAINNGGGGGEEETESSSSKKQKATEQPVVDDEAPPPAKKTRTSSRTAKKAPPPTPPPKAAAVEKKTPPPAAAKKKKAPPAAKATPAKAAKQAIVPATPATPGSGTRKVMRAVPNAAAYTVHNEYDVKLMLSDQTTMNSNKFYKLQLLQSTANPAQYFVATNWGRLGEPGKHQVKGPFDEAKGITEFSKVFRSKTKNVWGVHPFVRHGDKYQLVETAEDDDGAGDQALGRLTEAQIQKGQAVLQDLRQALEAQTTSGKRPKKNTDLLGSLTNDFYSLIPTQSGRQRPPKLDNLEIVTEKEGLLEFWLRMGFDEISNEEGDGSPIEGVHSLPVPPNLRAAASSIADSGSIASSQSRGKELASQKAGGPVQPMDKELYAAILLYTGNSIYRELNRCLRTEWKSARKYWNYLRLYFAAMECMPKKEVTLWRGIAADLYDEYEPGKVITWWMVSSCTSSKSVAENFMNQLGSTATLLTLHTKTACDISSLSFYPHEQESLLSPGTKLKVLNRNRKGKVVEIEVEEIVE